MCSPVYRGTGGRLKYIAEDWSEIKLVLPLSWRTRNYVGTIFGGSIYSAVDPIYMLMPIRRLGPEFIVWDKSSIQFASGVESRSLQRARATSRRPRRCWTCPRRLSH
jgi:hypothetical protein